MRFSTGAVPRYASFNYLPWLFLYSLASGSVVALGVSLDRFWP